MVRALIVAALLVSAQPASQPAGDPFWERLRNTVHKHLGRPYVWGASGLKSFDCSGFVWRVMYDNGVYMKRTTARKLYMSLPKTGKSEQWKFGNVVFFDNLKHCGIVNDAGSFYHAESTRGTTFARMGPYWSKKVCGVRRIGR